MSFAIVMILVPVLKKFAIKFNITDSPNRRKIHETPKPLLGGFAIYCGVFISYLFYIDFTFVLADMYIWFFGIILVILGVIDDKNDIKAVYKLIGQVIVALLTAILLGGINVISIGDMSIIFPQWFGILVEMVWIVALINAFNLIDGLDGLSSGIALISLIILWIIMYVTGENATMIYIVIMIGALLGFLYYNFYPSEIFLGDAGSMFIGYYIGVMSIDKYKTATFTTSIILLLVVAIPLLDILLAIVRRRANNQKVFTADALHFHHRLLRHGLSHQQAVLIMYAITGIYGIEALIISFGSTQLIMYSLPVISIITILVIEYLYMLSDKYTVIRKTINIIRRKIENK